MTTSTPSDALPSGTRLQQYLIAEVLGQGAFGITYLAQDKRLQQRVAIKEFLPEDLATRSEGYQVRPRSSLHQAQFEHFRSRFLDEARTLARFRHTNLVRVQNYLEENNTAYLVMEYEEGQNLSSYLHQQKTKLSTKQLCDVLMPLLDGLEVLHATGIIHRDIKPANIYVRRDGSPVLLDFGAARQIANAESPDKTITSLLTAGYAPMEQYYTDARQQGPWTDIYALGAVAYQIVTGKRPQEANLRSAEKLRNQPDPLPPATQLGKDHYPISLLRAIDWALNILSEDRPPDIASWRKGLTVKTPSLEKSAYNEQESETTITYPTTKKPVTTQAEATVPFSPPKKIPEKMPPSGIALIVFLLIIPGITWLSGLLFQYQDWYFPFAILNAENNGQFFMGAITTLLLAGYLFYSRYTLKPWLILLGLLTWLGMLGYLGWLLSLVFGR